MIFCVRQRRSKCSSPLGVLLTRDISVEKALEEVERAYAKLDVKL